MIIIIVAVTIVILASRQDLGGGLTGYCVVSGAAVLTLIIIKSVLMM